MKSYKGFALLCKGNRSSLVPVYSHSLWEDIGGHSRPYGTKTVSRLEQFSNATAPTEATESGIATDFSALQL